MKMIFKKPVFVATAVLAVGISPSLFAQEDGGKKRPFEGLREEMVKRFDKDGDGKLSDEERKAARAVMAERRKKAQERNGGSERDGARPRRGGRDREGMRERMLKRYDVNKNGELDGEEREKAAAAWKKHREEMAERGKRVKAAFTKTYDKDGDGKLSEEEEQVARKDMREKVKAFQKEMLSKYDADKDGKMSREERDVAHQAQKAAMLEKFDEDKDGKMSKAERDKAFEVMLDEGSFRLMHHILRRPREQRGGRGAGRKDGGEPKSGKKKGGGSRRGGE